MKPYSKLFLKVTVLLMSMSTCVLYSCGRVDVYEKNATIPSYAWSRSHHAKGEFQITDTNSLYNIYIVLRHLDKYAYNNIWLNVGLKSPGDSMYNQKVNLTLGNDVSGWEGTGMNDIWEVRKLISGQPRRFKKAGDYQFDISHIMRDEPLQGIMSAGLRVEKAISPPSKN
jgi:gliding motility-associated lipoprotein GldH